MKGALLTILSLSVAPALAEDETWCEDAACCKKIAQGADGKLCDDFYNPKAGVAYSMFDEGPWKREAGHSSTIFHSSPPAERLDHMQWCTSITHAGKGACPYPGSGAFGVVLGISEGFDFWKYFEQCSNGGICAQCTDGFKCGVSSRKTIPDWTFEKFQEQKNAVVAQTGTQSCKVSHVSQYNEFDTNGLSSNSLAGVFVPHCLARKERPQEATVCKALQKKQKRRNGQWPVFEYLNHHDGRSSLRIERYLDCSHSGEAARVSNATLATEVLV